MKKLNAMLNCGIGDAILTRNIFDGLKDQYREINITPNNRVIEIYRNGDKEFKDFIYSFMQIIFKGPPYSVKLDQDYPKFSCMDDIYQDLPISNESMYSIKTYSNELCVGTPLNIPEYIVISTKVRGAPFLGDYITLYKEPLMATLKKLSDKYKIVIIGERDILDSVEYGIIGPQRIYCMYDDLMSNLSDTGQVIDLTVSGKEITIPSLKKLQQDCLIMHNAKNVISLGYGGNLILTLASAKSSTNFVGDESTVISGYGTYYVHMSKFPQRNGICITTRFIDFNEALNNL